jgi:hypothetical protein
MHSFILLDLRAMKHGVVGILALIVLALNSCSEDFKIGAPYKNVTIVYGLLSQTDTAQYIKITRGYLDENGTNFASAQKADSIFYKDLTVTVESINASGTVLAEYPCTKVELADEGYSKDAGTFATTPNYAYKFKAPLNGQYRLRIVNNENAKVITATCNIVDIASFSTPLTSILPTEQMRPLNFASAESVSEFRWTSPANSEIVDVVLRVGYEEKTANNPARVYKVVDLPIASNIIGPAGVKKSEFISRAGFIGLLSAAFGPSGTTDEVARYIDTPSVIYSAGGVRMREYVDATRAQGGITADEIRPVYKGGFVGDDVYGLFDSRVRKTVNAVPWTKPTVDSMILNAAFKGLNIVGVSGR